MGKENTTNPLYMENSERRANTIERRGFVKAITLSSIGGLALGTSMAEPAFASGKLAPAPKKVLMKLGCQSGDT